MSLVMVVVFVVCHMKQRIMKTLLQMLIAGKEEATVKQMRIKDSEEHENGNLPFIEEWRTEQLYLSGMFEHMIRV